MLICNRIQSTLSWTAYYNVLETQHVDLNTGQPKYRLSPLQNIRPLNGVVLTGENITNLREETTGWSMRLLFFHLHLVPREL